ncbi:uncharacterized protein LOC132738376 [Ruditapes philippinarum]|uniref:uncharacterized protein LOC132738376 n=1 Tax=Ruditapes philippinarum TaxID=129788 RepID=UPI00295AD352|nr:uncharacterized protein LOC132738376 [Ruditapes philippinarum]
MHHAITCSGMLPVHYTRFADTANIGSITKPKRRNISKVFNQSVNEAYESSIDEALLEEIAWYEDLDGIDIMTDARMVGEKNAKDSSIVALVYFKRINSYLVRDIVICINRRFIKLEENLLHTRHFVIKKDVFVTPSRESQVELRQQIDSLAGDLQVISSSQATSVDLESYVKKLNNSRRRVMLVNNILQNVQERLTKLYNNVSRETARRKVLLDPPGAGSPK